ncbi:hypothetical protein SRHO_G00250500 [Serrasalmus rhombeus]
MTENIYENSEITYNRFVSGSSHASCEDIHRKKDVQEIEGTRPNQKPRSKAAVCLGLLCVLLLGGIAFLWLKLIQQRDALSYLDKGWKYSNSRIYYISTEKMTWDSGRKACKEKEADLVIINSREEQILVAGFTKNQNAWIGLTDGDSEGVWKWVDDSALTTGFWRSEEPNSYVGDEDCVVTGYGSDPVNNWADYPCTDRFISICERPFDLGTGIGWPIAT